MKLRERIKMNKKKEKYDKKFNNLIEDIKNLIESFLYESYTECKDILSEEITKKVKASNIFSHFGGKYKTLMSMDPYDNSIIIEVKTDDNKYRLLKFEVNHQQITYGE